MEKKTFCYVYCMSAHFSIADLVYGFYFEDKDSALKVREILFECSDMVDPKSESYCACVTLPNKVAIDEEELEMYQIYKNSEDFINNNKTFKRFYGSVYNQIGVTL